LFVLHSSQTNTTVTRTYQMGIRFHGTREERRDNEKEANQRVKGLQVQQEDLLYDRHAISEAVKIARLLPNKQSKFATGAIQAATTKYSNISSSAYYWLFIAAKGTINKEKKVSDLLSLLNQWSQQGIEWIVFGRSPRIERTLLYKWKTKRLFSINIVSGTRRQIDKYCPNNLKFNSFLPAITQAEVEKSIICCFKEKQMDLSKNSTSSKATSFLKSLEILKNNVITVAPFITSWINISQKSRWGSLKKLSTIIADEIGYENRKIFSALRTIVVFALSPHIGGTVQKIIQSISAEKAVPLPFMRRKKGKIPIILLMKKDYVVLRPGNAKEMTELAKKYGKFNLGFTLKGFPRITGTLVFSPKILDYLRKGANIKVLLIQSGISPSYKIKVSVVLEGDSNLFLNTKCIKELLKSIQTKKTEILGLDINRLGEHMITFSNQIPIPPKLEKLVKRYLLITNKTIPELSFSLKSKSFSKKSSLYVKTKGELYRVYQRRKKLLKEIYNLSTHFIAAVIIKSKCEVLCIEDLNLDPRSKRGSLAKAIYNMPDDENIYYKASQLASKILKYPVQLISVNPQYTSTKHNECGGILKRHSGSYDFSVCDQCNKKVNTHHNAAKNIESRGRKIFESLELNTPFTHTRDIE